MADTFQKVRIENHPDGSADGYVGIGIEDPDGTPDPKTGDRPTLTCLWMRCSAAHVHGWQSCNVAALAAAQTPDGKGGFIAGTSVKELLVAFKAAILAKRAAPLAAPLPMPTKQVDQLDDKGVAVLDDKGAAVKVAVPDKAIAI